MSSQSLVKMANDIGRFFAAEPRRADAVAGIAGHIQRFWEPRMLRKIAAFARDDASGLDELPREAVLSLRIAESPGSASTTPSAAAISSAAATPSAEDASRIFEFERDFAQSLRCVPMSVRLKLDVSGVKISLKQWNRLTAEDRQHLLELPCDGAGERERFGSEVRELVAARSGQPASALPEDPQPPWAGEQQVPEQISNYLQTLALPPLSLAQWQGLSAVRRFSLLKLSRPGHDNENFMPALREFGLLSA